MRLNEIIKKGGKKKQKPNEINQKASSNMKDLTVSVITLNVNILNISTKRQRLHF